MLPQPSSPFGGIAQGAGSGSKKRKEDSFSPGVINRPPLVLAKPEDEEELMGGGGGRGGGRGPSSPGAPSAPTGSGKKRNRGGGSSNGGFEKGKKIGKEDGGGSGSGLFYQISYHLYGLICMGGTIALGLVCSLRPSPSMECSVDDSMHEEDGGEGDAMNGGSTAEKEGGGAAVRVKKARVTRLDERLLHPVARKLWCHCCYERKAKGGDAIRSDKREMNATLHRNNFFTICSFSMEKRRSQMVHVTSIEEDAIVRQGSMTSQQRLQQQHLLQGQGGGQNLDPMYRQGSIISRQSVHINGNGEQAGQHPRKKQSCGTSYQFRIQM